MFRRSRPGRAAARRADSRRSAPLRFRTPSFEVLEDRRLLAVFTVNSNLDVVNNADGVLTLREAVAAANANPTTFDTVNFAASLNGQTIQLSSLGEIGIVGTMAIDAS